MLEKHYQNILIGRVNEMKYLTSEDYGDMCEFCKKAIDDAHMLIIEGLVEEEYIIDNEGPSMLAYDQNWFCEGC